MEDFEASSLHLLPCSVEDYFNIPAEDGVYDLIEGILMLKEMADEKHDRSAAFWAMTFNDEKPERDKRVAMLTPSVEISQGSTANSNNASSSSGKQTILRPDMAIGKLLTPRERRALPKESRDVMFPKGHPPDLTLETTSCNPTKDLSVKPKMYLESGVSRVHTLHRDKRGKGKNAFYRIQKMVDGNVETETTPISNDPINDPDARKITSKQLMHPPPFPDHNVRKNKAKERAKYRGMRTKWKKAENEADTERNRADAAKNEADTERNRADAAENRADTEKNRADAEKNRADAEKNRADALQKRLDALTGNPTESSAKHQSSPYETRASRKGSGSSRRDSNSPPRRRQKRSHK